MTSGHVCAYVCNGCARASVNTRFAHGPTASNKWLRAVNVRGKGVFVFDSVFNLFRFNNCFGCLVGLVVCFFFG